MAEIQDEVKLPAPLSKGTLSLEECLARRRSLRYFADKPLELAQISRILWAAQGITDARRDYRTAPSAGATYPIEIYLIAGKGGVEGLGEGLFKYIPAHHSIKFVRSGEFRDELARNALNQRFIYSSPASLVLCGIYERTAWHYGKRARRFVHMEIGHAAQNIYLQSAALGLGTVAVGSFNDEMVGKLLGLEKDENPLYIMPLGTPARSLEL